MRVGGERVNDVDPKDRNMAMVFQSYAIYPHLTVRQNMEFPLKLRKVPADEMRTKVEEAARLLELTSTSTASPANLSGGQRQRVAMGRAIVREPAAFLMDEPLSNLDAKLRVQMRTTISKLQQRLGTTTIYVTHDQVEAMTLGDRVAVMRRGEVQQVDSPRVLYTRPGQPVRRRLHRIAGDEPPARQLDGHRLSLPMVELDLPAEVTDRLESGAGGEVIAGIRPENFEDAALVGDAEAPGGTFTARMDVIEWLGSELFAHFEVEGSAADQLSDLAADLEKVAIGVSGEGKAEVVARLDVRSEAREQADQELWIDARAIHLFDPDSGRSLLASPDTEAKVSAAPALAKD